MIADSQEEWFLGGIVLLEEPDGMMRTLDVR